jgi:hypothetical protein
MRRRQRCEDSYDKHTTGTFHSIETDQTPRGIRQVRRCGRGHEQEHRDDQGAIEATQRRYGQCTSLGGTNVSLQACLPMGVLTPLSKMQLAFLDPLWSVLRLRARMRC